MRTPYNRIAGENLDRLAALSDGIFAVAMTLLVLNLHIPEALPKGMISIDDGVGLLRALIRHLPNLLAYFMSFLTLGILWVGQQTQLNHFRSVDRNLTWLHLGFLLALTLIPFSTSLLATFITNYVALLIYWLNILLMGVTHFASWRYASHIGHVREDMATEEMSRVHERRLIIAQSLYALTVIPAFIVKNTSVSIVLIVLIQLNYAIAPRIPLLDRL
ncbi:MAG: DUF1211 domain-containing protein [Ktedonobacteraceae bacterium]|nr:DUF1211 domain-containing protein [Ktedonobacteraceae bacterium]